ncbi:indole-3-glycerol phosphate synthase TrpC [Kamptonema cortianum]|nr:indole-3-glycerol phosphate synthase TrpC [Geitlerinema splendidum]MDK3158550.1 indole-3-glycerol phosphate synthase TrpC [Kamptonema cortianum]
MNVLDRIFATKRKEVASRKSTSSLRDLRLRAEDAEAPRGFLRALEQSPHSVALIAEVKKASPVKGVIRESFDPIAIARAYESAGADCLSVLTDVEFFQGSPEYLIQCRAATTLPVLRKDFTTDEYHVYEARAMGADAILLIVNGLDRAELKSYRELAESLGMDVLVEAHTLAEAEIAVETGARMVGVNNRDLETFETNIEASEVILPQLLGRAFLVSESALRVNADVERVRKAGAGAVLIGTAFCSNPDVEGQVRQVMGWPE